MIYGAAGSPLGFSGEGERVRLAGMAVSRMSEFFDVYSGRRVLVTGHTGFKGSWLALWLLRLGASVTGYSAYLPSDPCNFVACGLAERIESVTGDVRDLTTLEAVFQVCQPEIVFHLAAQPIVRRSYDDPKQTFDVNAGGTVNVAECVRRCRSVRAVVFITSDKCYQNQEWVWGYRETDRLGGDDPYSASKACAEIIVHAYVRSFFSGSGSVAAVTARAGNVIGGGDWAEDRIVPDCIRAFSSGQVLIVRSPDATRPWQHVLEPLSGYLLLGSHLWKGDASTCGGAFNFGPRADANASVKELVEAIQHGWPAGQWQASSPAGATKRESRLLKLNCDRALHMLGWHAALDFEQTLDLTVTWYREFYAGNPDVFGLSSRQVEAYVAAARMRGLPWTR